MKNLKWWHWVLIIFVGLPMAFGLLSRLSGGSNDIENFICDDRNVKVPTLNNLNENDRKAIAEFNYKISISIKPTIQKEQEYLTLAVAKPYVFRDERTEVYNKGVEVGNIFVNAINEVKDTPTPKFTSDSLNCVANNLKSKAIEFLTYRRDGVKLLFEALYRGKVSDELADKVLQKYNFAYIIDKEWTKISMDCPIHLAKKP